MPEPAVRYENREISVPCQESKHLQFIAHPYDNYATATQYSVKSENFGASQDAVSSAACHFLPLRNKYFPRHPVLNHNVRRQRSHIQQTTGTALSFFTALLSRREENGFQTEL